MNFRVVDEHGRQLGHGRNLGALKAEWGAKARGAFQALAGLKLGGQECKSEPKQPSSARGKAQAAIKKEQREAPLPTGLAPRQPPAASATPPGRLASCPS
jgi:ATP-dependent helicase HrpA